MSRTESDQHLVDWSKQDFEAVEQAVLVAKHSLHETDLFTDEALCEVIDSHAAEDLSVNTMGTDPMVFDWREGDRNGVAADELLKLVKRGQLWINCRKMIKNHKRYSKVINNLLNEIEAHNPRFRAEDRTANLLISSPTAWVPYHVDMPMNMLWHIRGVKRVWVYPFFDTRFASAEVLSKVCSNEWSEDVPYDRSFDKYALVYDAQPGQLITWPQLTPHRVTNIEGLNVSLSTEHKNARARRRINVHVANNLFRKWGFSSSDIEAEGWKAHAKQVVARANRVIQKLTKSRAEQFVYPKTFVVDPKAEYGFRLLEDVSTGLVAPHEELHATSV